MCPASASASSIGGTVRPLSRVSGAIAARLRPTVSLMAQDSAGLDGNAEAEQRQDEQQPTDGRGDLQDGVRWIGRIVMHLDGAALRVARRDLFGERLRAGELGAERDLAAAIFVTVHLIGEFHYRRMEDQVVPPVPLMKGLRATDDDLPTRH